MIQRLSVEVQALKGDYEARMDRHEETLTQVESKTASLDFPSLSFYACCLPYQLRAGGVELAGATKTTRGLVLTLKVSFSVLLQMEFMDSAGPCSYPFLSKLTHEVSAGRWCFAWLCWLVC